MSQTFDHTLNNLIFYHYDRVSHGTFPEFFTCVSRISNIFTVVHDPMDEHMRFIHHWYFSWCEFILLRAPVYEKNTKNMYLYHPLSNLNKKRHVFLDRGNFTSNSGPKWVILPKFDHLGVEFMKSCHIWNTWKFHVLPYAPGLTTTMVHPNRISRNAASGHAEAGR